MESLNDFFIQYGYIGMALAAFLAGTFVPFSSETVLGALIIATSMDPVLTVLSATVGNVLGSMANYYIGRVASVGQISRWMHVKERRLFRVRDYVEKHGSWIATFSFLPAFGTAISIALGILRANVWGVLMYSTLGKLGRYIIVGYSAYALKFV